MAPKDYFFEDHNPYNWPESVDPMLHYMSRYAGFMNDDMSQWLLDTGFFNDEVSRADRTVAREWIREYWPERWGYDFYRQWNWKAWRDWAGY